MSRTWLDKKKMSYLALSYCINDDDPRIRKYVNTSLHSYLYCRLVKDRPEVRKNINNSKDAREYCNYVRDDIDWLRNLVKQGDWNSDEYSLVR